jgi:hypothetical protein
LGRNLNARFDAVKGDLNNPSIDFLSLLLRGVDGKVPLIVADDQHPAFVYPPAVQRFPLALGNLVTLVDLLVRVQFP